MVDSGSIASMPLSQVSSSFRVPCHFRLNAKPRIQVFINERKTRPKKGEQSAIDLREISMRGPAINSRSTTFASIARTPVHRLHWDQFESWYFIFLICISGIFVTEINFFSALIRLFAIQVRVHRTGGRPKDTYRLGMFEARARSHCLHIISSTAVEPMLFSWCIKLTEAYWIHVLILGCREPINKRTVTIEFLCSYSDSRIR